MVWFLLHAPFELLSIFICILHTKFPASSDRNLNFQAVTGVDRRLPQRQWLQMLSPHQSIFVYYFNSRKEIGTLLSPPSTTDSLKLTLLIWFALYNFTLNISSRGVQPTVHRPHAAPDDCECGPTQNHKFT